MVSFVNVCPSHGLAFIVGSVYLLVSLVFFFGLASYYLRQRLTLSSLREERKRPKAGVGDFPLLNSGLQDAPIVTQTAAKDPEARVETAELATARELDEPTGGAQQSGKKKKLVKELTVTVDGLPMTTVDEKAVKKLAKKTAEKGTSEDKSGPKKIPPIPGQQRSTEAPVEVIAKE